MIRGFFILLLAIITSRLLASLQRSWWAETLAQAANEQDTGLLVVLHCVLTITQLMSCYVQHCHAADELLRAVAYCHAADALLRVAESAVCVYLTCMWVGMSLSKNVLVLRNSTSLTLDNVTRMCVLNFTGVANEPIAHHLTIRLMSLGV